VVGTDGELRVAVRLLRGTALLFEAEMVAAEGAPLPPLAPLAAPEPPRWRDDELYTTGMFHGPLFQGIRRLIAWDGGGLDAELADTPLDGFFGWGPSAPEGLLLNPVLLDLTGHVTAFWIAQGLGTDFSSFPSSIGSTFPRRGRRRRRGRCYRGGPSSSMPRGSRARTRPRRGSCRGISPALRRMAPF